MNSRHDPRTVPSIISARQVLQLLKKEYSDTVPLWKERLETGRRENRSVAVCCAGSRGVTFLNMPGAGDEVCIDDLNPHKH